MSDKQLEQFVHRWAKVMTARNYVDVQIFADAGDMGRDVVGFLTKKRHEGPWHNFQCKQLARTLQIGTALLDLGKVIYYSFLAEFILPVRFTFVAPRGTSRTLERLLYNPTELKAKMISDWPDYCRTKIVKNEVIELEGDLLAHLEKFDFSCVDRMTLDDILADPSVNPVLAAYFGADPGSPPPHTVPTAVGATELPYVNELVGAYGEREGCVYTGHDDIMAHPKHSIHFNEQRERFYQADAFSRFYRDNTLADEMDALQGEIYHGVIEKHREPHPDRLARVNAVMSQAASIPPTGLLAKHARVPIRQGICHLFVNDGKLSWRL
ncbi:hypothetical protein NF552_25955 (plasmid) [Roseomonas mucosa]|nr:hypothetical protein NF552_25955 [Roseomonas mucosa]